MTHTHIGLDQFGISDLDQKHLVIAKPIDGEKPLFTLLWRASGPRGKPLPKVGDHLTCRVPYTHNDRITVRVIRVDPPGTPIEAPPYQGTLVIKP